MKKSVSEGNKEGGKARKGEIERESESQPSGRAWVGVCVQWHCGPHNKADFWQFWTKTWFTGDP